MLHAIDPKIDCVFKALLGAEENRALLMHFLNAFLAIDLVQPIVWVEILNPYNEREYLNDKLSVVDVKAKDSQGRLYQIEIQLAVYRHLSQRIVYNWADLYSQQLKTGEEYAKIQPTYALWLLGENLIPDDPCYVHHYKLRNEQGQTFVEHGGIWLLELNKFQTSSIETEQERWLKFFIEGEQLDDTRLPDWMNTQEMKQAMNTLSTFSEKEKQYFQYQARQEYLRQQRSIELERNELESERNALKAELDELESERNEAVLKVEAAIQREEEARLREEVAEQKAKAAMEELERLKLQMSQK